MFWKKKKKLSICFSKFKCLPTLTLSPPPTCTDEEENAVQPNSSTLLFNHLYEEFNSAGSKSKSTDDFFSSSDDDSDSADTVPPDFATVFGSQRFFFSSPGRSNSIIDINDDAHPLPGRVELAAGGIAIQTDSSDPYVDFRRSMQEMIQAHESTDVKVHDWDFLHQLLLCYLSLNPKHTHKIIVAAFSDLVVTLMAGASADHEFIVIN